MLQKLAIQKPITTLAELNEEWEQMDFGFERQEVPDPRDIPEDITAEELQVFYDHVSGDKPYGDETYEAMQSLYSKLPSSLKYSGVLYRGIGIGSQDFGWLLTSGRFESDPYYNETGLSSWTTDVEVAKSFAIGGGGDDAVGGIVLKSNTDEDEPLMVFGPEVWEFLKAAHNIIDSPVEYFETLENYVGEREIITVGGDSAWYYSCDDIIYLYTWGRLVAADFTDEEYEEDFDEFEGLRQQVETRDELVEYMEELIDDYEEAVEKIKRMDVARSYEFECTDGRGSSFALVRQV